MPGSPTIMVTDQRQITVPNGGLSAEDTDRVASFFCEAQNDGYIIKSVAARQKDIGSQREPHVVTEAVVVTFGREA